MNYVYCSGMEEKDTKLLDTSVKPRTLFINIVFEILKNMSLLNIRFNKIF